MTLAVSGAVVLGAVGPAHGTQTSAPQYRAGTAHTLPAGHTAVGVLQPLRYGIAAGVEIATHPLLGLLAPNVAVKRTWGGAGPFVIATRHGLSYPSGLFAALAREGAGGVLPYEARIPHMIGLSNGVLATAALGRQHWVTLHATLALGARIGRSTLRSVDLPLVLARMAPYHRGFSGRVGVDLDGHLVGRLGYSVDGDAFLLPYTKARYALEHSALLVWSVSESVRLLAGYKITYGPYPYGRSEWNLGNSWVPFPLLDLHWQW